MIPTTPNIPNIPSEKKPLPIIPPQKEPTPPLFSQKIKAPQAQAQAPASSEKLKLKLASHLKQVTENYHQHLPFSTKRGVISSLLYSLDKFIRKVLGKAPPLPFSEIELRFTMHLFRNFDAEALNLAYRPKRKVMKGLENQIPFSTVLKVWSHFFSTIPELQKGIDVNALKKCEKFQKEIEEARLCWKWRRNSKIRCLSKNIGKDLKNLQPSQKMYIPGGALTPASKSSVAMDQMLYEVSRSEKEPGQFIFKVIHVSSQLDPQDSAPLKTYLIPEENLQEKMEVLLFAQTVASPQLDKMGPLDFYRSLKKGKNPLEALTSTGMTELQGVLKEFKKVEVPEEMVISRKKREEKTDPEKIYEVFQKTFQGDSAKEHKLLLKTALFLHIFECSEKRLSDPIWNKWMRDNAIQLLNSIEKRVGAPENEDLREVEAKFLTVLEALGSAQKRTETRTLPPSPQGQKEASLVFDESPLLLDKQLPMGHVMELKKASVETKTAALLIDFLKVSPQEAYVQLKSQINEIGELIKKGNLEASQEKLEDFFAVLQNGDAAGFIEKIPPTDMPQWSSLINDALHHECKVQFGLNIQAPIPSKILSLIKCLEITQKLAHLRGKEGGFSGYAVDMTAFKEMIKDPYLDLGGLGPKITQTIDNIEKASEKHLRMTMVNPQQMSGEEQGFYRQFMLDHPHLKIPPDTFLGINVTEKGSISSHLPGDFGQEHLLPLQVVHLKQAALLSQMMMARYQTLHFSGVGRAFGEAIKTKIETDKERKKGSKLGRTDLYKDIFWKRHQEKIDRHLASQDKPLSFKVIQDVQTGESMGHSIKIHPFGVCFHEFGSSLQMFQNRQDPIFRSTGERVANKEIRERVAEGKIFGEKDDFSYPSLHSKHERVLTEEKKSLAGLPLDVSAELQLMQAGTIETRIPLTLGFFMNHPTLLTDDKLGIDLQRVFKLNLFRTNALGLKLAKEPEYADAFVRDLERLMRGMEANQNVKGALFLMEVFEEAKSVFHHYNLKQLDEPCEKNLSRLQAMLENAETSPHKKWIYQTVLHHYHVSSQETLSEKDLENILKSYLLYQQMPKGAKEKNFTRDSNFKYLMRTLQPKLQTFLANPEVRDKTLSLVLGKDCHFEPSPSFPLFTSGNVMIDVVRGRIFEDRVAKSFLPSRIIQDPICRQLFGSKELFNMRVQQKDVKVKDEVGEQYEFSAKNKNYRILSFPSKPPLIYRQEGKEWFQWQNLTPVSEGKSLSKIKDTNLFLGILTGTFVKKLNKSLQESLEEAGKGSLPQNLLEMHCWVSPDGGTCKIDGGDGKPAFEGKMNLKGETCLLQQIREGESKREILNPWKDPHFEPFQALGAQNQVVLSGYQGKVDRVYYPRHDLEYQWKDNQWQCLNLDGYALSKNSVDEKLFPPYVVQQGENPSLFAPYFKDYHLLEHPSKQPRLLISGDRYEPAKEKGVTSHLLKYKRVPTKKVPTDSASLYAFEVDPIQGLKSETQEGYLYLAYLLLTQKRYAQSVFYLRKAADVKVGESSAANQIVDWFKNWKDPSIEASALQVHLYSLLLEQNRASGKAAEIPLNHIQRYVSGKVHPLLDLSERQKLALGMGDPIDSAPFEQQIQENAKVLHKPESAFPAYEKNLFIESLPEFLTASSPADPQEISAWKQKIEELKTSFKIGQKVAEKEEFWQELGQELITDLEIAIQQRLAPGIALKEGTDLKKLSQAIVLKKETHLKKSAEHQAAILNLMTFPSFKEGFIGIARQLEQYDALKNRYFEEALYCSASHDFRPLIEAGIIQPGQEKALTTLAEDYLVEATAGAQYQKAADFVQQLQKGPSEAISTQFHELLNTSRHFDPKTDPYRLPILLMEYVTKNIAFKSQVQNVRDMLSDKNVFKHEALAGGKTTILRNIISKIKADGVTLSGVMTHEPLFGMHHPLYEKTTREAYGEKAGKLSFSRNNPSDVKALKLIHTNMVKAIAEKGRISTTRSDVLSLRNIFLQKYDELWKGKTDPEVKHAEIDALSDILELLMDHTTIGNDELEKILAPDNENNYTSGEEKGSLNEVKSDAALELTEWLLEDPRYKTIFQMNQHAKMNETEARQLRIDLSQKIHDKYLPGTDLKQCTQYLMGEGPFVEQMQFYQTQVVNSQNNQILFAFHKFLSEVVKGSFLREGGDGYKRSVEGIEVKHARDGKANPRSEFGTEEETIWYTCLNYMDLSQGGVTAEQMGRIVGKYQDQAFQENLQSFKDDPSIIVDVTQTKAFKAFKEQFGLNLLEVTPENWVNMAATINMDPKKLIELLRKDILPHYAVSPEKIAANSQDLVSMLHEIYGSSGTSNNWRALPDSIKKELSLLKQKGVDGAVLARLYQTYVPGDIIAIDSKENLAKQVGAHLSSSQGASLIDLGPFFPGKSSKAIGETLKSHLPKNQPLRLLDEQDEVEAPQGVPVEELLTIYGKANCRGTNLVSGNDTIGFVTIGPLTTLTDFLQAVMRMRKLGKGQKVKYLLDPAIQKQFGPKPNLGDLIQFLTENEAEMLKNRSHIKGEKQKIPAIAKGNLFRELVKTKDRDLRMAAQGFRPFFFKPSQESLESCGMPKEEKATSSVVNKMAKEEKAKLEKLLQGYMNLPGANQEPVQRTISSIQDAISRLDKKIEGENRIPDKYLPKLTLDSPFDLDIEQEQEKEQEQEIEAEKEQEQEQEVQVGGIKGHYEQDPLVIFSKDQFVDRFLKQANQMRPLQKTVQFYDSSLFATNNLLQKDAPWGAEGVKDKVKGQNRILMSTFIVDQRADPPKVYTVFGNIKDHDLNLRKVDDVGSDKIDIYHLNMQTGNFDGRLTQMKNYSPEIQEKIVRSIVQAKFFAGQTDLVKPSQKDSIIRNEKDAFKKWLQEQNKDQVSLMEVNLKKYLKEYRPSLYAEYHKSEMAAVFKELL